MLPSQGLRSIPRAALSHEVNLANANSGTTIQVMFAAISAGMLPDCIDGSHEAYMLAALPQRDPKTGSACLHKKCQTSEDDTGYYHLAPSCLASQAHDGTPVRRTVPPRLLTVISTLKSGPRNQPHMPYCPKLMRRCWRSYSRCGPKM